MNRLLVIPLVLIIATSCGGGSTSFTDLRDGQEYKTVQIGDQLWMAENLNYEMDSSWCFYNDSTNCELYGRLYKWEAAMNACPVGWLLPSDDDWTELINFLGGESIAGGKMKSCTGLWIGRSEGATNESGFTGLPGGYYFDNDPFFYLSYVGYWWSATDSGAGSAWTRTLYYANDDARRIDEDKGLGISVRCVKD